MAFGAGQIARCIDVAFSQRHRGDAYKVLPCYHHSLKTQEVEREFSELVKGQHRLSPPASDKRLESGRNAFSGGKVLLLLFAAATERAWARHGSHGIVWMKCRQWTEMFLFI